jgi:hypothetical protein
MVVTGEIVACHERRLAAMGSVDNPERARGDIIQVIADD